MKPGGQRTKGASFERLVCKLIREHIPGCEAHRSSQADRAWDSDVVIVGGGHAYRLWIECCHAAKPDPLAKLEQAELDVSRRASSRLPVVVWRRNRGPIEATMRLRVLDTLRGVAFTTGEAVMATLPFADLLELLA